MSDRVTKASSSARDPTGGCEFCKAASHDKSDKFCRSCGALVLLECPKCQKPVRVNDRYCGHCGSRRWRLMEMFRAGIIYQSPLLSGLVIVSVAALWTALYLRLRR